MTRGHLRNISGTYSPLLLNNAYVKFYELLNLLHDQKYSDARNWYNPLLRVEGGEEQLR